MRLNKIGWKTGLAIVVANMIGTGVFTSLGFQLEEVQSSWSIVLIWIIGGLTALAGAFCYAEIGTSIKESGGEYIYLSKMVSPLVGYLSGWISISVGFAAPIALAAIASVQFLDWEFPFSASWMAIGFIAAISLFHSFHLRMSAYVQNALTLVKILVFLAFIACGIYMPGYEGNALDWSLNTDEILSPGFAVALVFVSYSYTGWNAAAYISEEFKNPRKNLPRALIGGALLVLILYTLLQIVFLKHASVSQLIGQVDVGAVASLHIFGEPVGHLFNTIIALFLLSSISAMVWIGPRVVAKMGDRYEAWSYLMKPNRGGVPVRAIWFQFAISAILILTGTFEQILIYCGVLLQISSFLVVLAAFRKRMSGQWTPAYIARGYPFWHLLFLIVSVWIISFVAIERPLEFLFGFVNIFLGYISYLIVRRNES